MSGHAIVRRSNYLRRRAEHDDVARRITARPPRRTVGEVIPIQAGQCNGRLLHARGKWRVDDATTE